MCFEGEVDLLNFQKSEVLLIFFRLKGFLTRFFSALLPLGTLSSDAHFTFYCLGMFCFKTSLIHFDRSSFVDIFEFFFLFGFASVLNDTKHD